MFRLAHLSDVHLGPLPDITVRQLASKRLTGFVNWHIGRRKHHHGSVTESIIEAMKTENPSHVAITGDLINLGLDVEIENARAWLLSLGDPDTVSLVPGNHDAYVPGAFAKISDSWQPWMKGDHPLGPKASFPYIRIRENVALIGVSSARASAPFMATGYFRKAQAAATAKLLAEARKQKLVRIVMIHHPPISRSTPFHKRLIGGSLFRNLIRECGAEIVLHGHTHQPTLGWIEGGEFNVPVIGVAAAGQAAGGHRPAAQYNMLEIEGMLGNWRVRLIRDGIDSEGRISELSNEMLSSETMKNPQHAER